VFDLDGVITMTARLHFRAWKRLFDEVLRAHGRRETFGEEDYRAWVDGRPRIEGLRAFLAARALSIPEEAIAELAERKQSYFLDLLAREGADVDVDAVELIAELRARAVPVGLATSSKNAGAVLRSAGLDELFDARVDGIVSAELGLRGKPDPDIFLECLHRLGAGDPSRSVLFEDATAGVAAAKAGRFGLVIGVDRGAGAAALRDAGADWVVQSFRDLTIERIDRWIGEVAARSGAPV
jgi:alpha,alpha-trehalase